MKIAGIGVRPIGFGRDDGNRAPVVQFGPQPQSQHLPGIVFGEIAAQMCCQFLRPVGPGSVSFRCPAPSTVNGAPRLCGGDGIECRDEVGQPFALDEHVILEHLLSAVAIAREDRIDDRLMLLERRGNPVPEA